MSERSAHNSADYLVRVVKEDFYTCCVVDCFLTGTEKISAQLQQMNPLHLFIEEFELYCFSLVRTRGIVNCCHKLCLEALCDP